ncbi:2,3-diphosphoglycerate-dependent phosphoglycerate mutase [Clostridiaceae bacterium DONG20-135]|uniref:2,3-bisphosphoglycerate-dependent phosphoglycerate mutase n=1 Tax=Copranaerobaculum intestinale TaxID=2692629 RepID=A0A6N8U4C1_9FIRM|nr:2,3-diphosphoglycerate-dependent phosphoglycerate mutase [Copranaerobaculum intestinale]MXQ73026.1 2,3-diphosphoglycerate-dependent phosphoglycerate mutase [Copranaerobaculum intestinale]
MELVLLRHGESVWNRENRYTGWTDVDLSEKGHEEAKQAGKLLQDYGYQFDVCYTSYLKRAIHTAWDVLDEMDLSWITIQKTWRLNERHYGALQGINKTDTVKNYGEEQVRQWRRSYAVVPPLLKPGDARCPNREAKYQTVQPTDLPRGESLEMTVARVVPYYQQVIQQAMLSGRKVLVAAHGNSLRALLMYIEQIDEADILSLELQTGVPIICRFDEDGNFIERFTLR